MRIRAEPAAADFLTIVRKLFFAQPPLEKRARVDAGRGVGLEEHEIARAVGIGRAKKVIEPKLEDFRSRRIARDMAAEFSIGLIGADHHREGVPANDRGDPLLEREVARIRSLAFERDRVAMRREERLARVGAELLCTALQAAEQKTRTLEPGAPHDGRERFEPFPRFFGVAIDVGDARRNGRFHEGVVRHEPPAASSRVIPTSSP